MKNSKSKTQVRALVALLVFAVPACLGDAPTRVGLKPIAADLVFGIPPVDQPVSEPPALEDRRNFDFSGDRPILPRPPPPKSSCPQADLSQVDRALTATNVGRPKAGVYKWRETITTRFVDPQLPVPIVTTSENFIKRIVYGVGKPTMQGAQFSYKLLTVETPQVANEVRFDVVLAAKPPVRPPVDVLEQQTTVNGVYLTREREFRTENPKPFVFNPNPSLYYAPYPFQSGVERETTGVDRQTFETVTLQWKSGSRRRFDACGDLFDAWRISPGTKTIRRREGTLSFRYDYGFAPQYGSMLAWEHIEFPCPAVTDEGKCVPDPDFKYDAHLADLSPAPIGPSDIPKKVRDAGA